MAGSIITPENPLPTSQQGRRLVAVPTTALNTYRALGSGSAASQQYAYPYNSDGSGLGTYVNPSATAGAYVELWFPFFGRTFGVRMLSDAQPFSVSVDGGDNIAVDRLEAYLAKEGRQVAAAHEVRVVTHENLGPGPHIARIIFPPNAAQTVFLGYLVEDDGNILSSTKACHISTVTAVPTTSALYAPITSLVSSPMTAISRIIYANTTGSPIVVTWDTDTAFTVAANDIREFAFTDPIATNQITHKAATSGVKATAFGRYF